MSRILILGILLACLVAIGAAGAAASIQGTAETPGGLAAQAGPAPVTGTVSGGAGSVQDAPPGLSPADQQELLGQQDAQKFVRDTYGTLGASYRNLAEFNGMAADAGTLFSYGNTLLLSPEPADPGIYMRSDLQQLYGAVVGTTGPDDSDALTTAAMVEDMHIAGLTTALGMTGNADVRDLYTQEKAVAANNLRAFARQLSALGTPYEPQYLSTDAYTAIVQSPPQAVNLPAAPATDSFSAAGKGLIPPSATVVSAGFASEPSAPLSAAETQDILMLQEEEKMERDLYQTLYGENTGIGLLQTMAQAADTQMNSDNVILARYGISYTPGPIGTFGDQNLQVIYNDLLGQTSVLSTDVLSTAAQSEDMHIADLVGALDRTNNADLTYIYRQQLVIAENNLREINRELVALGGTYAPQYLSQDAYNRIIATPVQSVPA